MERKRLGTRWFFRKSPQDKWIYIPKVTPDYLPWAPNMFVTRWGPQEPTDAVSMLVVTTVNQAIERMMNAR